MSGVKGRSGRRPIPDEIKKERGTYREPTDHGDPVHFPLAELVAPEWVADDSYANDEWDRVVPLLSTVRVLTDPDLFALANYCMTCSIAIRAAIAVNEEGMTVASPTGFKANPHIKIAQDARAQSLRFAIEFGLTPAARSRIHAGQKPDEKKDPAEDFLFHPPVLVKG